MKVICSKCKGFSVVNIQNNQLAWVEIGTVISARFRFDHQWGFQCYCGQNNIMTKQEIEMIANPEQPTPRELEDITKHLVVKKDTKFRVEA